MICVDVNIVRKGGHKDVTVASVSGWNGEVTFTLVCTTNIGVVEYCLLDKSGLYLTDVSGRYLIETKGE